MFVETSLIVLAVLDGALIYLIFSYNRQGTINRFLALLLLPITLANIEMLFLYPASSSITLSFGVNFAVFDMNFFFPLIYHFSFYFPRKRLKKKQLLSPIISYIVLCFFGIGLAVSSDPDISLITFRDIISPSPWLMGHPFYYSFYMMNFIYICVLLGLTIKRMLGSLKLPLLKRERKTVIMVVAGLIPLSVVLIFNYLIFIPFEGGIYFFLVTSAVYTFYFIILLFRFGFLDMKSINRVFLLLPGLFILLVVLYSRLLPPLHNLIRQVFGLNEPVVLSLEILLFITVVPPGLRLISRFFGKNRPGESEFFFHTLKDAASELVRIIALADLDRFVTELFIYRLRLRHFYFLVYDEASETYKPLKTHHGEEYPSFPGKGALVKRLTNEKKSANTQQMALSWEEGNELEILDRFKVVLIIPLLEADKLAGIFLFSEPGVARTWRNEEIEEIEMFASGIPVVIARCRTHAQAIAMEQKQAKIERMAVLHEITSGIAHELRNPLSIISNSAETIADRDLPGEEVKRLAGYIEEETTRMAKLLSRILAFVPRAEYHHGVTNIVPVIEKTFDLFESKASKQGTRLIIESPSRQCAAVIDREALTQVCLNLALNALEAVGSGGYIRVRIEPREDLMVIAFSNNGVPIPEEIRVKLFDPFFTTKENGTGLGLSISSRLIEEAGGSICYNGNDHEVMFEIHLPVPGRPFSEKKKEKSSI